jgi:glycosyltransferase involved in cell wall biosynthesis
MRIWFAANIPADSFGGVGRSMRELAAPLRMRGHDVTIIYSIPALRGGYILFAGYLFIRLCMTIRGRPDWIIARSTDGIFCAIARRLLNLKTRVALHNHGWEEHVVEQEKRLPARLITAPTTWKARLARFTLLRAMLRLCDICISGTVCEIRWIVRKYPSSRRRCVYVPNGVAARPSVYWAQQTHAALNFLCVGGPTWKKNIEHSIAVFSKLKNRFPNARLYIVGTGAGNMDDFAAGVENLTIIPAAPLDEMDKWYTTCPFLLASPRFEGGHSLAILEAMSYGSIVFVSPVASTLEFVRDSQNGYVLSGCDPGADALRIGELLMRPEETVHIRKNAYHTSQINIWERQALRLEKALCQRM